jgi:hypothetical protein
MKALLLSGLPLALLTGGALAQVSGQPSAAPALGMASPPPPPTPGLAPPPPPPPGVAPPPVGPGAEAGDMDGPPPPLPPGGPGPRGQRPSPPPEKAAHFRLQRGDALLDVKCADEEPMKACADLALQMVDRLQALPKP